MPSLQTNQHSQHALSCTNIKPFTPSQHDVHILSMQHFTITIYVPIALMFYLANLIGSLHPSTTPSLNLEYLNLPSSLPSSVYTLFMFKLLPILCSVCYQTIHPCGLQVLLSCHVCSVSSLRRDTDSLLP